MFHELRDNVERALEWIARFGDADGDGYVEYASKSSKGLANQGWKDSGDAIVNVVHDEIVVETGAAETARTVEEAMCAAGEEYVKKVPVKVETKVADEWVK